MAATRRLLMRVADRANRELDRLPPGKLDQNATSNSPG